MVTGEMNLPIQSTSYQSMSENFLHVSNIAKACAVFGDIFIEFSFTTK